MKPRETFTLSLGGFLIYLNKLLFFECFSLRNENLPKQEGRAMSSKAACPHPPIPPSPEAQERMK